LGTGPTAAQCPYDTTVFGVNRAYEIANRLDKLFITDKRLNIHGDPSHDFELLKTLDCQIVSLHSFKELKTVRYPYKRIVEHFHTNFFTDTICYMIAYALYKGYDYLRLYGVDMATRLEYLLEKGGIEFWLGMAMGMGCKIEVSRGSTVMVPHTQVPYGFVRRLNMKELDPTGELRKRQREEEAANTLSAAIEIPRRIFVRNR